MVNLLLTSALISSLSFFSHKPNFEEPLAYPRTAESGLSLDTAKYLGLRIYYLNAMIGKHVPVLTYERGGQSLLQLGIEAGTWITLGYDEGAFPLLTQDFLFSIPLSFRLGDISGALKFNHISAHLGDGMEKMIEETLTAEQRAELEQAERYGMEVSLTEPFNYSRDFLSLLLSYDFKVNEISSRMYTHVGYAHKIFPDDLQRWYVGSGTEFKYPLSDLALTPYYAQDFTWNGDVDNIDYSGQLGVLFFADKDKLFESRLALTGYFGSDRRGQLLGRKLRQVGIGLFIR